MTEIDELKAKWQDHSLQLEQSLRVNRQLLKTTNLSAVDSGLRREAIYAGLEAALWLLISMALGHFLAGHIRMPALALSAGAVDLMSIGMIIASTRRAVGALQVDYGSPVAALQKQVEALRLLRIHTTKWSVLCGALLWVAWCAVLCSALFAIDIYKDARPAWLVANLLFGLALFPAALWVSKKYANRSPGSPFIQRLMNDLAGSNLIAVQISLARLKEFESE